MGKKYPWRSPQRATYASANEATNFDQGRVMTRVILVVEGQTEEAFVNQVLAPELSSKQVYVTATRIMTSQSAHKMYKGGFVNFAHLERDISRLLSSDKNRYVGCMVDLYRLPTSVPGYAQSNAQGNAYAKVQLLHQIWLQHFGSPRFIPFVQLHEFEALLYADPQATQLVTGSTNAVLTMTQALAQVGGNPELVNQTPAGAPSMRLLAAFPGYQKVVHGVQIAQQVGLQNIQQKCIHFKTWFDQLSALPAL